MNTTMELKNVILYYRGFFDYNLLNKLLNDFTVLVKENNIPNYFFKKIQIVMVEVIENNYQYIQSIEKKYMTENFIPEFKILHFEKGYKIFASNPILIDDAEILKSQIEKINKSDISQQKELYKETLKDGMYSKKITAGTGLIRIAKVTKNKIIYSFKKINNKLLYYTIEITINPK